MTREEAIKRIDEQYKICEEFYYLSASPEKDCPGVMSYMEALAVAISALRPVSRERVEKAWKGEWKLIGAGKTGRGGIWYCTRCEKCYPYTCDFCPRCGAPMTDEAVELVMKRMETIR